MIRFFKKTRGEHQRGFFSFISESIINLHNASLKYPNEKIKIYYDLSNIYGYGTQNIVDVCFIQDINDFTENFNEYSNVENVSSHEVLDLYQVETFSLQTRLLCEKIIKEHLILNEPTSKLHQERNSDLSFDDMIGVHIRSTDMFSIHNFPKIKIEKYFELIEKEDFNTIFLMSDNKFDIIEFKKRYGNRVINYDESVSSENINLPFFKLNNDEQNIKKHIEEIVYGAFTMGKVKKLICSSSNLTTFSILSNSNLVFNKI